MEVLKFIETYLPDYENREEYRRLKDLREIMIVDYLDDMGSDDVQSTYDEIQTLQDALFAEALRNYEYENLRFELAKFAMHALISNPVTFKIMQQGHDTSRTTARYAVELAKAVEDELKDFDTEYVFDEKTKRRIEEKAAHYKKILETPDPEVDKIISELKEEVKNNPMPKSMTREQEIAYILEKADGGDKQREINKILEGGENEN